MNKNITTISYQLVESMVGLKVMVNSLECHASFQHSSHYQTDVQLTHY